MKDTEYAYAAAYMKTLENKMLSQNDFDRLISASDAQECIKILIEKGYGKNADSTISIDALLMQEIQKVWEEAKNVCPPEAPLDILLYKNDFHNLKTVLKAFISGDSWEGLMQKPCTADPGNIEDAIKTLNFTVLPEFISEAAKNAYDIITKTNDGQLTEIYIDKEELAAVYKKSLESRSEFLIEWSELEILIANMKIAARCAGRSREFAENAMVKRENASTQKLAEAAAFGEQEVISAISSLGYPQAAEALSESFSAFEKWCDNLKLEFVKKAKRSSFGFEPVMSFLIGKEYELQTVRIIVSCKINGVDADILKERLRDLYV